MSTKHLMKKLPSCLLGAILAAGIASTTMVNAVDGVPPGLFELDGNIPDGATAGDDWGSLYDNTALKANLITFTGITADPAPASIFTQGGSKDVNDVSAWRHTNGSVPDKDDITNAYAAAYSIPANVCLDGSGIAVLCSDPTASGDPVHEAGDLIVYFGLDRYANNGDAHAGFWFFQNEVSLNANGTFNGIHTAKSAAGSGDVFVVVQYPQDTNTDPIIKVYEWDPNDFDNDNNVDPAEKGGKFSPLDLLINSEHAQCDGTGAKLACAITNLSQQPSPPWLYTPKSGTGLPFESFFEGGINVSQVLGSTPCFASFLAETRSSSSQTAQLKDFVLDAFPVCGAAVTKSCEAVINNAGDEASVKFKGTASNTGGQEVFIVLDDDQSGATFTAVCFDNNGNGACGDLGDVAVAATLNSTASFTLGAGQEVVYEGNYPLATPVTAISFSDTVTLTFYADNTQAALLGDDAATATCGLTLQPDLSITKECDPEGGGVRLEVVGGKVVVAVDNKITVTNNGQEALTGVTISDTEVPTLVKVSGGANLTCGVGTGQCTGSLAFGETVVFEQSYYPDTITGEPDDPSSVSFTNTASAEGTGAISGTDVGPVDATAECVLCPPHID